MASVQPSWNSTIVTLIQEYSLICKLASLLPLLLFYPLSHIIWNAHLHGDQLDLLIGDELPREQMRFPAFARDC